MQTDPVNSDLYKDTRFIMYHKTPASGRTVFFRQNNGGACVFDALPKLSQIIDDTIKPVSEDNVITLPTPLLKSLSDWMQIEPSEIEIDNEFYEKVDAAGGTITVYLLSFKTIDPPYEMAERVDGKFVLLTEMRDVVPTELELLRRAYAAIMEG